jgi:hypothetical protein
MDELPGSNDAAIGQKIEPTRHVSAQSRISSNFFSCRSRYAPTAAAYGSAIFSNRSPAASPIH